MQSVKWLWDECTELTSGIVDTQTHSIEELAEGLGRCDELERAGGESAEAVVAVECRGLVVLGVDHQSEDRNLGAQGAHRRVEQQRAPESAAPEAPINGKSSDAGRRVPVN